jgi:hypothetical protein
LAEPAKLTGATMAEQAGKAVAVEIDHDDLMSVGRDLMTEQSYIPEGGPEEGPPHLRLGDLLQDANGEVVLYNDSRLPVMALDAAAGVVDQGQSGPHVTAAGDDVSGFRYLAFDNGLTLYYQHGLELIVRGEPT